MIWFEDLEAITTSPFICCYPSCIYNTTHIFDIGTCGGLTFFPPSLLLCFDVLRHSSTMELYHVVMFYTLIYAWTHYVLIIISMSAIYILHGLAMSLTWWSWFSTPKHGYSHLNRWHILFGFFLWLWFWF